MFCFGLVHYWKKMSIFLFLAAMFAVPFLGELIVSIRRPIFLDQTLIWIMIPLFLILAAGIAQLKSRILIIVVMGILVNRQPVFHGRLLPVHAKRRLDRPCRLCRIFHSKGNARKDDLILFNSTVVQIPFDLLL